MVGWWVLEASESVIVGAKRRRAGVEALLVEPRKKMEMAPATTTQTAKERRKSGVNSSMHKSRISPSIYMHHFIGTGEEIRNERDSVGLMGYHSIFGADRCMLKIY